MINKQKWAEIIKDFHEKEIPPLIERDIEIPIEIPISRSISIIGPRRSGKTYEMFSLIKKLLLKNAKKEQILYINFESANIGMVDYEDLVKMLETFYELYPYNRNKKVWLFLDEIQNVSNWEKFVRTALDNNLKVYLSGSSSKLLSAEIATSMRGRNLTYTITPFSFKEFLRANNLSFGKFLSSSEKAEMLNLLREHTNYGGYPETIIYKNEREKILNDIKDTTILKDVIERHKIRNVKSIKLLIDSLINSKEFSINKFYNFLKSLGIKIGKNALYNYVEYLNEAFFVFLIRKFSYSYKEAAQSISKPYFVDNGLLKISGINEYGRLLENLVFLELFRRKNSENFDIYYYKNNITKEEVDFVLLKNKKVKQLIQVCYDIEDFNTYDREVKAIIKASRELKCNNMLTLTWDYEKEEKISGKKIKFIPLWKWILKLK